MFLVISWRRSPRALGLNVLVEAAGDGRADPRKASRSPGIAWNVWALPNRRGRPTFIRYRMEKWFAFCLGIVGNLHKHIARTAWGRRSGRIRPPRNSSVPQEKRAMTNCWFGVHRGRDLLPGDLVFTRPDDWSLTRSISISGADLRDDDQLCMSIMRCRFTGRQ